MKISKESTDIELQRKLDSAMAARYKLRKKLASDLYSEQDKQDYQNKLDQVIKNIEQIRQIKIDKKNITPWVYGLDDSAPLPVGLENKIGFSTN